MPTGTPGAGGAPTGAAGTGGAGANWPGTGGTAPPWAPAAAGAGGASGAGAADVAASADSVAPSAGVDSALEALVSVEGAELQTLIHLQLTMQEMAQGQPGDLVRTRS